MTQYCYRIVFLSRKSCFHAEVLASRLRLGEQSRCWQWLAGVTAGVLRAFTKAAKTDSDIAFVLVFHVST